MRVQASLCGLALVVLVTSVATAQIPGRRPGRAQPNRKDTKPKEPPPRPTDPLLLDLHKEFVSKSEKLAAEFEKKRQYEKARQVYEALLRLLPEYPSATQGLERVMRAQLSQDRKIFEVSASRGWQDAGVTLIAGNPVHLEAKGTWQVANITGPKGIQIPKEVRKNEDFKIGALIAILVAPGDKQEDAEPFAVGDGEDFVAKRSGRLFFRMYDIDPKDNRGQMTVLIQSEFGR